MLCKIATSSRKKTDDPIKPEKKNNEDIEDKTFYCYRRMQDLETKCCKQCEKTMNANTEDNYVSKEQVRQNI
jgi:hypothetical protein